MQVIETVVYEFDELSDKAKEKAREWYRSGAFDYDWHDYVQDDFHTFLKSIGFEQVTSQFSGFWCQGDGASFDFKALDFVKLLSGQVSCEHASQYSTTYKTWLDSNATLIRQAKRFMYNLTSSSYCTGFSTHYCHENTRRACLELSNTSNGYTTPRIAKATSELQEAISALMRNLAIDYYKALENEYEYLNSDECVDDNIRANEYTFTESGKRFE